MTIVMRSALPLPLLRVGKVREVYEAGPDELLLVASDRISAFDVVMDEPIPDKGRVLTQMSAWWFNKLAEVFPSHFISASTEHIVKRLPELAPHQDALRGRSMLVRRTTPVPFECVIRGYITGSAWAEYRKSGTLAGERLKAGLVESERLDPALFSPATKAESGHDENVTFDTMAEALGAEEAEALRLASFRIYEAGRAHAVTRGIIIADTMTPTIRNSVGSSPCSCCEISGLPSTVLITAVSLRGRIGMTRPSTSGLRSNRSCQYASEITTTGAASAA
jgi:phosphoribosylaminoimidazole-succinocarboxamide synthase